MQFLGQMSTFLPSDVALEELQVTQNALYETALIDALVDEGAHIKVSLMHFILYNIGDQLVVVSLSIFWKFTCTNMHFPILYPVPIISLTLQNRYSPQRDRNISTTKSNCETKPQRR